MKTQIEVESRAEAEQIRRALNLPDIRAFVRIVGMVAPLSTRARQRVLTYAADKASDEQDESRRVVTAPEEQDTLFTEQEIA